MENNELKDLVCQLAQATGTSGDESFVKEVARKELKKYGEPYEDVLGNLLIKIKEASNGAPHILLDAHIDEIGLMIQAILPNGFVKVANIAGMDIRILASAKVWIHTNTGSYMGIVTSTPPHLQKGGNKVAGKLDEIYVDTGFSSKEAEEKFSIGDRITLDGAFGDLLGNRIVSKALDDRAGCAAILWALHLLESSDLGEIGLSVSFTSREECGGQGAATAAYQLKPDIAIAVDATPSDQDYVGKNKVCAIGDGVAIGVSPVLDRNLSDELISIAKEEKISYTIEVMGKDTGTNADEIQVSRHGVKCSTLSIPQRYAHTGIEVMDLADIEYVAKLIQKYIERKAVK